MSNAVVDGIIKNFLTETNYSEFGLGDIVKCYINTNSGDIYFDIETFKMEYPTKPGLKSGVIFKNGEWQSKYWAGIRQTSGILEVFNKGRVLSLFSEINMTTDLTKYGITGIPSGTTHVYVSTNNDSYAVIDSIGYATIHYSNGSKWYVGKSYTLKDTNGWTKESDYEYDVIYNNKIGQNRAKIEFLYSHNDLITINYSVSNALTKRANLIRTNGKVSKISVYKIGTTNELMDEMEIFYSTDGKRITEIHDNKSGLFMHIHYYSNNNKVKDCEIWKVNALIDKTEFSYYAASGDSLQYTIVTDINGEKEFKEFNDRGACIRVSNEKGEILCSKFGDIEGTAKIGRVISEVFITGRETNLVKNSDFSQETTNGFQYWTLTGTPKTNLINTTVNPVPIDTKLGKILKINDSTTLTERLSQTISSIYGKAGDKYTLLMWFKGTITETNETQLISKIKYVDNTEESIVLTPAKKMNGWQLISIQIETNRPHNEIVISFKHKGDIVYLSSIGLFKGSLGKDYEYDGEGNIQTLISGTGIMNFSKSKTSSFLQTDYGLVGVELDNGTIKKIRIDNGATITSTVNNNVTTELYESKDGKIKMTDTRGSNLGSSSYNKLIGSTMENGTSESYYYNTDGTIDNVLDVTGTTHKYSLDPKEYIKTYKVKKGTPEEQQSYDEEKNNNLFTDKLIAGNQEEFIFESDERDRVEEIYVNDSKLMKFEYDDEDENPKTQDLVKRTVFGRSYENLTYEEDGKLKSVEEGTFRDTPPIGWLGHVLTIGYPEHTTTVHYDSNDKVESVTRQAFEDYKSGEFDTLESYEYDELDRVKKVTIPSGEIKYGYDGQNQVQTITEKIDNTKRQFEFDYQNETSGYTFANFMMRNALKYEEVFSDYVLRMEDLYGLKSTHYAYNNNPLYGSSGRTIKYREGVKIELSSVNSNRYDQVGKDGFDTKFSKTKTVYGWISLEDDAEERTILSLNGTGKSVMLYMQALDTVAVYVNGTRNDIPVYMNYGNNFVYLSVIDEPKNGKYEKITVQVNNFKYEFINHGTNNNNRFTSLSIGECSSATSTAALTMHLRSLSIGAYAHSEAEIKWIYDRSSKLLGGAPDVTSGVRYKDKNIYGDMELVTLNGSLTSDTGREPSMFTFTDDLYENVKGKIFEYDKATLSHVYANYDKALTGSKLGSLLSYDFRFTNQATVAIKAKPILAGTRRTILFMQTYYLHFDLYITSSGALKVGYKKASGTADFTTGITLTNNKWHDIVIVFDGNKFRLEVKSETGTVSYYPTTGMTTIPDIAMPIQLGDMGLAPAAIIIPPINPPNDGYEYLPFKITNMTMYVGSGMTNQYTSKDNFNGQLKTLAVAHNNTINTNKLTGHKGLIEDKKVYDTLGRVKKRELNVNNVKMASDYTYHTANSGITTTFDVKKITRTLGNNKLILWQNYKKPYNSFDDLTEEYVWDKGNLKQKKIGMYTTDYTYDYQNRLLTETIRIDNYQVNKIEMTYGLNGNIMTKKTTNYATGVTNETYTYDDFHNANLVGKPIWKDRLCSVTSDSQGATPLTIVYGDNIDRPASYGGKSMSWLGSKLASAGSTSYTYNHNGIRTSKIVGNAETKFYLDGSRIMAEKRLDGTIVYYNYDENNQLIGFEYSNNKYFYVRDVVGNINYIVDKDGNVLVSYRYDAWGKLITPDVFNGGETAYAVNSFLYKGYYYDKDEKWYYLNSRYYDPQVGRFISADDTKYLDFEHINGLNLFAYCVNNPIMFVDYSGHWILTAALVSYLIKLLIVALVVYIVSEIEKQTHAIENAMRSLSEYISDLIGDINFNWGNDSSTGSTVGAGDGQSQTITNPLGTIGTLEALWDNYILAKSKKGKLRPDNKRGGSEEAERKKQSANWTPQNKFRTKKPRKKHTPSRKTIWFILWLLEQLFGEDNED